MKKTYLILLLVAAFFIVENTAIKVLNEKGSKRESLVFKIKGLLFANNKKITKNIAPKPLLKSTKDMPDNDSIYDQDASDYTFPKFYRGMYLNVYSARNDKKLHQFIRMAKKSYINTFVMDCQSNRYRNCIVTKKNVDSVLKNGIHPIARIVVFPRGLRYFPVSKKLIERKLRIAESACKAGFKEIQFDYIRFSDTHRVRRISLKQKYAFINSFLRKAKIRLKKYNVKIAADIFGRIPINRNDAIVQKMEELDKVADIICPMAYPSHYTWSKKLQYNPYYTVYITSKRARDRTKNAEIVSYIQAFKMRLGPIPYYKYIKDQIRGVHDAKIRGFLFWNARQIYTVPLRVTKNYYGKLDRQGKL
jgi:hypothetical protein